MSANNSKQSSTSKNNTRVVFTGKRVKGTWSLESALPSFTRRTGGNETATGAENRRVRTLH